MLKLTVYILHTVSKRVKLLGLARFEVFIVVLLKSGLQCLHLQGQAIQEDEGTMILQNVGNYTPNNTALPAS
jgi:hypothetical protein